jgi:hypothetical protein
MWADNMGRRLGCAGPAVLGDVDMTCDPAVEMVKEYCLAHREVDFHTTAITFSDLAATDLSR